MPLKTLVTKDFLVNKTTEALRSYSEPYHLEYPRLLARGLSKTQIGQELNKGMEFVDMHINKFYDKVPGLASSPEKSEIIALAFENLTRLGPVAVSKDVANEARPPIAMTPLSSETIAILHKPLAAEHADTKKPAVVEIHIVAAPEPAATAASTRSKPGNVVKEVEKKLVASSPQKKSFVVPEYVKLPTDKEIAKKINGLAPAQRKFLEACMSCEELPTQEKLVELSGLKTASANAAFSTIMSIVGLKTHAKLGRSYDWLRLRYTLFRSVYFSDKVLPASSSRGPGSAVISTPKLSTPVQEPESIHFISAHKEPRVEELLKVEISNAYIVHDDPETIVDVCHVIMIPNHMNTRKEELLKDGYRVEQSYGLVQLAGLVTVLVLVKRK